MASKRQGSFAQKHQEEESFLLQLQREIDYEAIGSHLRTVREQHGCTQAEFSEIMHLSTNYYGLLETGSKHINLPRFIQFICITQCSADRLLRGCHKDYPCAIPQAGNSEKRRELNCLLDKCDDGLIEGLIAIVELLQKRR